MPTLGSLVDQNSQSIQELIGTNAIQKMSVMEPMFRHTVFDDAAMDTAQSELGRGMRIRTVFHGSVAGVIRSGQVSNNISLYGDKVAVDGSNNPLFGGRLNVHQATQTLSPNPLESASPRPVTLQSELFSMETTLPMTFGMMQLEATQANIQQYLTPMLDGWANLMNITMSGSLYLDPNNQFRLGSLGPTTGTGAFVLDGTARTVKFFPTEKCLHRFVEGQQVDFYKSTGTILNKSDTTSARVRLFVTAVDEFEGSVLVQAQKDDKADDGTAGTFATWATTANITSAAYCVPAFWYNSGFGGLYTLRDWIKWAASTAAADVRLLGSRAIADGPTNDPGYIDVRQWPFAKSFHRSSVGILTERTFMGFLQGMMRGAVRYGHTFDTAIASDGVWLNMWEQRGGREFYPREGGQQTRLGNMGFDQDEMSPVLPFDGGKITCATSRFIESGQVYILRRKGNWRIVTPPDPAGASRGSLQGKNPRIPLTFVAKSLGMPTDRIPLMLTAASGAGAAILPSEVCHLPAVIRMQFMPVRGGQIAQGLLEGVTETRYYSN